MDKTGPEMWNFRLGIGRGPGQPKAHSFEIDNQLASIGEHYIINIRHSTGHSRWKLQDEVRRQHDLPFSFESGKLRKFSIIPEEQSVLETSTNYSFECVLSVRPKLRMPIATMYSITTVEVKLEGLPSKICPNMSIRRKGETEWQTMSGCLITFNGCDEIYEAQLEYEAYPRHMLKSRILEVSCLWQKFEIEKEIQIHQDAFYLQRKFEYFIRRAVLYCTKYIATMRMIEPTDNDDYNKEIEVVTYVDANNQTKNVFTLVPGARYEFKMNIKNIGISIPRIIEVPADSPIDQNLWRNFFGDADPVIFCAREAQGERNLINYIAMAHGSQQYDIELRSLTLYQHGIYSYKLTFQTDETAKAVTKLNSGGTFKLVKINPTTARISLSKLFKSQLAPRPPAPVLTPINAADLTTVPMPLQLPELIRIINDYANDHLQPTYRLVCKSWCLAIQPTISGTLTSTSAVLFNRFYALQV